MEHDLDKEVEAVEGTEKFVVKNSDSGNVGKTKLVFVPVVAHGSGGYATAKSSDRKALKTQGSLDNTSSAEEEIGGVKGPEPTRFGDWEQKGKCIDF